MKEKSSRRSSRGFGLIALVLLLGLLAANYFGVNPFRPAAEAQEPERPSLLVSIQDMSQYHAAVGNFEVIIDSQENGISWLPDFVSGERTLFLAKGTVNAYVDLGGLTGENYQLSEDGKKASIRLPAAQLDKPNLNVKDSYIYDQRRGVGKAISDAFSTPDQSKFFEMAETRIASAAEESELRDRATENTKAMITGMLKPSGVEAVFVE